MNQGRDTARLFGVLVAVALPPLVLFAVGVGIAQEALGRLGLGTFLLGVALLAVAWAGVLTLLASRLFGIRARSVLDLATRGELVQGEPHGEALAMAAGALTERNRQVAELARHARSAAISDGPQVVAADVVRAGRIITGDPTWELAVLRTDEPELLPVGVYDDDPSKSPGEIGEVHRWAATVDFPEGYRTSRRAQGPWGTFLVVDVLRAASGSSAILLAPHEGRAEPTAAELDLLTLLGEHSAASLEHAILLRRVHRQADELDRLAALQRDFLRAVSHDLQAPLASIAALTTEVRASAPDPSSARDLEAIAFQTDRLRRMVGQLLTMSRVEAGALTPRQDVFRLQPVVERAWHALRADRPFVLTSDGDAHLVVADPDRVEQVVWALLDNAVKYSPPATPIAVGVRAQPSATGLESRLTVADRGAGMSEMDRARAFDLFFRSESARRQSPDGSGVGLYAARGLIEAMGGSISIESRLGSGTTVTVVLPAETADTAADPGADAAAGDVEEPTTAGATAA